MQKPMLMMVGVLAMVPVFAQTAEENEFQRKARESEVWEPVPAMVATPLNAPPSDAIVLFDGKSLDAWESVAGGPAPWTIADGAMTVLPHSKNIRTKQSFCDVQLHVEWRSPMDTEGREGQARGNSGVFLQGIYEVQVLDSHGSQTYPNGQAASIYKQSIPLVNASRGAGEWQTYDIIWSAPRFSQGGGLTSPARITVLHNGVLVQNNVVLSGSTEYSNAPSYSPHGCAPIELQDHGDLVSFRNIWVRELASH